MLSSAGGRNGVLKSEMSDRHQGDCRAARDLRADSRPYRDSLCRMVGHLSGRPGRMIHTYDKHCSSRGESVMAEGTF
jgi:hypothetical protein